MPRCAQSWKASVPTLVYCGDTGNGHVAKLIQNAVASCNRLLTYEAAAMGVKYGLKLADMAP
jgi:3-hydroxyisobutyrate dehydrogenase